MSREQIDSAEREDSNMNDKLLITAEEAAERYSLSISQVYKWASAGKIPAIRISKKCLRFNVRHLDQHFLKLETEGAKVA